MGEGAGESMSLGVFFSRKVCARMEEERRSRGELRSGLEKEREELRAKLRDATSEVRNQHGATQLGHFFNNPLYRCVRSRRVTVLACSQISRLEQQPQQQQDKKEKSLPPEGSPSCGPKCSRLEEELHQTRGRLARTQEEAERQRDRQQREIGSLRADKHRLEEKVLEQSRLNTERNLLDQSQRHGEDRIR